MLAAKVTDDYSWLCPDNFGLDCYSPTPATGFPPANANLFSSAHDTTNLTLNIETGAGSGVHLPLSVLRAILANPRSVGALRIDYCNAGWVPT